MKRITQSLFEEIEKITSGQIEEKKKVDHDKDGDNDFADVMMARMKAAGKSHKEAHKHTRKHNEEAEQEGGQIDEISIETMKSAKEKLGGRAMDAHYDDNKRMAQQYAQRALNMKSRIAKKQRQMDSEKTNEEVEELDELSKSTLGSYIKKRTKQLPDIEVGYQMAEPGRELKGYTKLKKKVNTGIGRAVDRLTKEEAEIEEAWPGTPEHKAKYGSDYEKHMIKYGGDPKAPPAVKGRYGNLGPSGSETPETAADSSKIGRGRKKMKEETIVKHEDFSIDIIDNPTFKDFLDAAKPYVQTEEQAIAVAESFFQEEDASLVIESQAREMFESVLDSYRKEGVEVTDMEISLKDDNIAVCYTVTESETVRHYIHQGKIIKGEE